MKENHKRSLVLNADYSPIGIIGWKRALIWSIRHETDVSIGVEVIDFYKDDYIMGTHNKKYPIPAVVKTAKYFRINNQQVNFSRKNIFLRDDYTCQYCDKEKDISILTYDHVIPKSQWNWEHGSPTCWTNIVTACLYCNRKKGNKTPKQANMPLKNLPIAPKKNLKFLPMAHRLLTIKEEIPDEWKTYLPRSYSL
jgi:5-methylcytosine-specific restriction endonuclease McrA